MLFYKGLVHLDVEQENVLSCYFAWWVSVIKSGAEMLTGKYGPLSYFLLSSLWKLVFIVDRWKWWENGQIGYIYIFGIPRTESRDRVYDRVAFSYLREELYECKWFDNWGGFPLA